MADALARLDDVMRKRARLLEGLARRPDAELEAHPIPEKWSILEIVEHLVLSEIDVLGDPETLAQRPDRPVTVKNRVLRRVVMFVLRYDIPVRAPSRGMLPVGGASLDELRARWEGNHAALRQALEAMDAKSLRRRVLVHPVAGPLTVAQGMRMLQVHLDRHIRQIRARERLLA